MKTGILVASFGTTYQETREKNIEAVERTIQDTYSKAMCYRAFSSGIVRRILKERDGIAVMDIREALGKMKQDGITHAYVQLTHVIDGIESNQIRRTVDVCRKEFQVLEVGAPLLTEEEDYETVARVLWEEFDEEGREKSLVFIGHGSSHRANEAYGKLEQMFCRMGYQDVHVATVEAEPDAHTVIERMRNRAKKQVVLAPLMLVAGDHATHDMAGPGEDSYLSKLTREGYEVRVVKKGLGEYEGIREIYCSHLKYAMKRMRTER